MINSKDYETEVILFRQAFDKYKDKRIVLYGIGRNTATLIPNLSDYNIIGLMDRDAENIGKLIYNLPVLSKREAELRAEMLIINTVSGYWNTIFKRVQDLNIPIFYKNGQRAAISENQESYSNSESWSRSYKELLQTIDKHEIISFDLFDTLIMRKVYLPMDVFKCVEIKIKERLNLDLDFIILRSKAIANLGNIREYSLDDIYDEVLNISNLTVEEVSKIKDIELETEEKLILLRKDIAEAYKYAVEHEKQVYILTDMYLPKGFLIKALQKNGLFVPEDRFWVSNEKKVSKEKGNMWTLFHETVAKNKKALHIGDNWSDDIKKPEEKGIDTYYILSPSQMLNNSSINSIVPDISNIYHSLIIGMVCARLFNSPFALCETRGRIIFKQFEEFGYCLLGGVITSFFIWLIKQAQTDNIKKLFFFARDGYLLQKDYKFFLEKHKVQYEIPGTYMAISRQLVALSSIKDEDDLLEVMAMPYIGTFREYMIDRFNIDLPEDKEECDLRIINAAGDINYLREWIKPYKKSIFNNIEKQKERFMRYLNTLGFNGDQAIIDFWYYGNTQYYLSKLINANITGYYFAANLSPENKCRINNTLVPCFQRKEDEKAQECNLFKQALVLESIFTAPYGMVKDITERGEIICDEPKENQKHFHEKIAINNGIQEYISDFSRICPWGSVESIKEDAIFSDKLFGVFFDHIDMIKIIKDSFYTDNGMVQRREFKIFE